MDLSNKIAVVTGSGQGIGKAIALRLAQAGAAVVVNSRSEAANTVAADIKAMGKQSTAMLGDVSLAADVNRIVGQTIESFGKIDILVNNAGITRDNLLMRMSDEEWDTVINVNLKSVFLCTRAVMRPMLKQRSGRIINITSIVGITGNPGQANYVSAKAGIIGFTRTLAKEVGSRSITVNAIAPGFIETDMTKNIPEKQRQELAARIPLGCFGTPLDVAEAAAFLASDAARYITGQVISVDGGMAGS